MFQNLVFSLNGVFPIFFMTAVGYLLRRFKFVDGKYVDQTSGYAFKFVMPVMLFMTMYNSDFSNAVNLNLVLIAYGTTLIMCFLMWWLAPKFIKDRGAQGAFIHGTFRNNYVVIGLSMTIALFGEAAGAKSAFILSCTMPLYSVLGVWVLVAHAEGTGVKRASIGHTLKSIVLNPLFIGTMAGLLFVIFGLRLPTFAEKSLDMLNKMGTPLVLLLAGASLDFSHFKKQWKLSLSASVIKTIVTPLIFLPAAYLLGLRGEDLGVIFLFLASPTAINTFLMAKNMGNDAELATDIVMVSTLIAFVFIFIGCFVLRTVGLI